MKKSGASQGQSASGLISRRTAELGDWRGKTLSRVRKPIQEGKEVDASAFKALIREAIALNSSGKLKPARKAKS